jgi:hypothetical protein
MSVSGKWTVPYLQHVNAGAMSWLSVQSPAELGSAVSQMSAAATNTVWRSHPYNKPSMLRLLPYSEPYTALNLSSRLLTRHFVEIWVNTILPSVPRSLTGFPGWMLYPFRIPPACAASNSSIRFFRHSPSWRESVHAAASILAQVGPRSWLETRRWQVRNSAWTWTLLRFYVASWSLPANVFNAMYSLGSRLLTLLLLNNCQLNWDYWYWQTVP